MRKILLFVFSLFFVNSKIFGIRKKGSKEHKGHTDQNKFRQMKDVLATPNDQHTASGAPGHQYTQQKVDYVMDIRLDETANTIYGDENITYTNNSPDELRYLWVQLDQNMRAKNSTTQEINTDGIFSQRGNTAQTAFNQLKKNQFYDFDGGFKIDYVQSTGGTNLRYTVNNTIGDKFVFSIRWWYNINDHVNNRGR